MKTTKILTIVSVAISAGILGLMIYQHVKGSKDDSFMDEIESK